MDTFGLPMMMMMNDGVKKQLQQPQTLQSLATNRIVTWVMWNIKTQIHLTTGLSEFDTAKKIEEMSRKIETTRNYFQNIPKKSLNNVLAESVAQISDMPHSKSFDSFFMSIYEGMYKRSVPNHWIEVFFTENITTLRLNSRSFYVFVMSFTSKSHLLTGLTSLEINMNVVPDIHTGNNICDDYAEFVKNIPNLKHLNITCPSDNNLRYILNNCKSIVELDLHEFYNTTPETLDIITQLPNIQKVNLFDSNEDENLESKRIRTNRSLILNYISTRKLFKIKSFVITHETSMADLLLLQEYSKIQSLHFINSKDASGPLQYLESFTCLQNLRELKISNYTFYEDGVKDVIKLIGRNLEMLSLLRVKHLDMQALKCIGQTCPYLKEITIRTHEFATDDLLSNKRSYPWAKAKKHIPLFNNLQTLDILIGYEKDDANKYFKLTPWQAKTLFMLENCPNIENIRLGCWDWPNDFMGKVLNINPLTFLKKLWMARKLDQSVIDRIKETRSPTVEFLWLFNDNITLGPW